MNTSYIRGIPPLPPLPAVQNKQSDLYEVSVARMVGLAIVYLLFNYYYTYSEMLVLK